MKPDSSSSTIALTRCQHRTESGRCRMPAVDPAGKLCCDHARVALQAKKDADFAKFLTGEADGFQTASGINCSLGDLYTLLAKGRISPRRASVLAYISSLLLRSLAAIDKDTNSDCQRALPEPPLPEPALEAEAVNFIASPVASASATADAVDLPQDVSVPVGASKPN